MKIKRAKIKCEICGQEISKSNYTKHLRRHKLHPETFKKKVSYKLNHEGLTCQYCGKECKNRNSLCNHERQCKSNPNRQIVTKIYKIKKPAWNKGLTKETDFRVLKGNITFKNNQKLNLHKHLRGISNPSCRIEVREKISKTCLEKSKRGDWHKSLAKNMHYNYKGIDLDGTWELNYAKYLDKNNIIWCRCSERFEYFYENKIHYYTPDFYLVSTDEYIEIKGYKTNKDVAKWNQFPKDKKLVILQEKDLKLLNIIK